jgi:hypothetical protein
MRQISWLFCLCLAFGCSGSDDDGDDGGTTDLADTGDVIEDLGGNGSDTAGGEDVDAPDPGGQSTGDSADQGDSSGGDGDVTEDIDEDTGSTECEVNALGFAAVSEPECLWKDEELNLMGIKDFAVLEGAEGETCLTIPELPVPKGAEAATIQWLNHRATDVHDLQQIQVNDKPVITIAATVALPPFYRSVSIDKPNESTIKFAFCTLNAGVEERWALGGLKVIEGAAPKFGTNNAGVLDQIELTVTAGAEKKILITVSDTDAQLEPFIAFPKYELWDAPAWVNINSQSVSWNDEEQTFLNWLLINPPGSEVGTFEFTVIVTDHQGLKANRWFKLNVQAP